MAASSVASCLAKQKAHQMVVGFGRGGILVERRYRDHGYAMVDGEMAREIGFGVLGDLAVVGQHEECAGAGQGAKTRVGQAGREAIPLGLVERRQVQVGL